MKTVLITGASSGIGKACAEKFAEKRYSIIGVLLFSYPTACRMVDIGTTSCGIPQVPWGHIDFIVVYPTLCS